MLILFTSVLVSGLVYPAFGVVYAVAIAAFQNASDHAKLRHAGDRNALWFFIIALLSMCTLGMQNYLFASAAAHLTQKLRSMSFKSILRQDIGYFDEEKHSVSPTVPLLCVKLTDFISTDRSFDG